MADTPPTKAKRKPQGPRTVKPKTIYIAIAGEVSDFKVLNDADAALDLQEAQPGVYKVRKHVLPTKARSTAPAA